MLRLGLLFKVLDNWCGLDVGQLEWILVISNYVLGVILTCFDFI